MPPKANVKVVSQKLRRAEAKLKQIPILKAQVKAQAQTIRKLEKKLKAFDEKDLIQQVKRLQEQLADVGKCTLMKLEKGL